MAEVAEQIQTTSNIPDWARPFASQLFGMTFGDPNRPGERGILNAPYEQYTGQRVAGVNPLMGMGYGDIAGMGVSPETRQAAGLAALAGQRAGDFGYSPLQRQDYYRSPLESGGYQQYMSPYMQGVVEQQKQGAVQDYMRTLPQLGAQAVRAGAKGGTREAILESEGRRGLAQQLGSIEATGLQNAFQQAQAQAAQDAAMRAQYGLAGQQLSEQSRQFGAGLGIQSIGQQLAAAGTLGGLGQQAFGQGLGAAQARVGAGMQMRDIEQAQLTNLYQDFINRQQYPYKQMEFASGILRGFQPTGTTSTLYQPSGSALGTTTAGLGSLFMGLGGFGGQQ